jgi:CTP:molybdopterin cytidylyltransferase MocA
MSVVIGVVLAAGSGTRMGHPKAEIVLDGDRLVDRTVAAMGACDEVLVVVREGVSVAGAHVVVNTAPERGMRSSLQLAIEHAGPADALAVMLVDLPGVTESAIAPVIGAWRPGRIAVGSFAGRRGHPTVMSPEHWRAALELAGPDEGARQYLSAHADLVDDVAVSGDPVDLDRPADLEAWTARHSN